LVGTSHNILLRSKTGPGARPSSRQPVWVCRAPGLLQRLHKKPRGTPWPTAEESAKSTLEKNEPIWERFGFIAFVPGLIWTEGARGSRSLSIPAPGSALRSHPCVALSSAPASSEFTPSSVRLSELLSVRLRASARYAGADVCLKENEKELDKADAIIDAAFLANPQ
jgi:hypothetical protein